MTHTHTNLSFDQLRSSGEFLRIIIKSLTSCVLLLDHEMNLVAFNHPLETIFGVQPPNGEQLHKCGNVIGCAYAVESMLECGTTDHCKTCPIRVNALESYVRGTESYKQKLSRDFYTAKGEKILKHLQFSSVSFVYADEKYILVIIEDITEQTNYAKINQQQQKTIEDLEDKIKLLTKK